MNFVITDLIKEQSYQCLIMFCAGILFMFGFQVCSYVSKNTNIIKAAKLALELIFWLATAVMFSEFLYYCANGIFSIHTIIAFGVGLLLWRKFFYDIITQVDIKGIRGFSKRHGKEKKK